MPRLDHQGHEKCLQRRKGRQEHAHRHKFQTSAVDRQTHECGIQKAEARNMHVYAVCKRQKPKSREDRDGVGKGVAKCLCDLFPFHLRSFPVWGGRIVGVPDNDIIRQPRGACQWQKSRFAAPLQRALLSPFAAVLHKCPTVGTCRRKIETDGLHLQTARRRISVGHTVPAASLRHLHIS